MIERRWIALGSLAATVLLTTGAGINSSIRVVNVRLT